MAGVIAVVLNGPPNVGKDTLAQAMLQSLPQFGHLEFKGILYEHAADWLGVNRRLFKLAARDRILKETPLFPSPKQYSRRQTVLTPREVLIHVSEKVYKPRYGDDYFGRKAAEAAVQQGDYYIITDGGFQVEVGALEAHFDRVVIVQLERADCSFAGDSRDYIVGQNTRRLKLELGDEQGGINELRGIILEELEQCPRNTSRVKETESSSPTPTPATRHQV